MSSVEEMREEMRGRVEALKARRRELHTAWRQEDRGIAEELASLSLAIRQLGAPPRARRDGRKLSAATQAGAANIARVREAVVSLGRATQADLARVSGVRTGTMTWAIRALEEAGEIRPTGDVVRGSRVFEATAPKRRRRVLPPE